MKINGLHALMARTNASASLLYKTFAAAVVVAMLLAAFSVSSVLAAKGSISKAELESSWQNKVKQLKAEIAIANRLQLLPTEVEGCSRQEQAQIISGNAANTQPANNQSDGQQFQGGTGQVNRNSCWFKWQQAQTRLERYRTALRQAQALLVNGGFNANGEITDQNQALISVQTMGWYLSTMRNIRLNTEGLMKTNLNNSLVPANTNP
jgi:hypothetical protein